MGNTVYNELRKAKEAKEIIPQTLNPQPADYLENYVIPQILAILKRLKKSRWI